MTKVERTDTMERINESNSRKISIGDKLWLIEELDHIGWMGTKRYTKQGLLEQPYQTKVVAIIQTETGVFYQVKNECTLSASNIGKIAFLTREEAIKALKDRRKDIMEDELVIENINVGDVLIHKGKDHNRVVCIEENKMYDNRHSYVVVVDESSIKHRTTNEITANYKDVTNIDYFDAKNWFIMQKRKYDIHTEIYRVIQIDGER